MSNTFFDLEANGFLHNATQIHCLSMKDPATGAKLRFTVDDGNIERGIQLLMKHGEEGRVTGHNILAYDIPLIQKFFPWFKVPLANVYDTLVISRLFFTDMFNRDGAYIKSGKLPSKLIGSHKLEAWGYRLGLQKGEYADDFRKEWIAINSAGDLCAHIASLTPKKFERFTEAKQAEWVEAWGKQNYPEGLEWKAYTPAMGDYCDLDVDVTEALYTHLQKMEYSDLAIDLEHKVRHYTAMMERSGWPFDVQGAVALYSKLAVERDTIRASMVETFPPLVIERYSEKTGKRLKDEVIEFNPGSRDQIASRLITKYGWEPKDFTDGGKPKIDEDILAKLPYEEAKILAHYFLLEKRIGQLSEGDQAWLKNERQGHIHHSINTNGAVTGRCTHSSPNIAQVPAVRALWGPECRGLFRVRPGFRQVGADLSGIELRCLAHFMSKWDNGAYRDILLNGDIHTENQKAAGLPTRDMAKTFIYAFLYGAGDEKIGSIVAALKNAATKRRVGKELKSRFLATLPALKKLKDAVEKAADRGHLIGLDGRRISVRSKHAALNTLLQGAGAMIAKRWLVEVFEEAERRGWSYGWDGQWTLLGFIHDELQFAVREGLEQEFGEMVVECAVKAGAFFNFRCPVGAEFKVGDNWRDCH